MRARGKLFWNAKGYAFVETKGSGEGIFIPPESLKSALDGDTVEVDTYRDRRGMRGRVVSIVRRADLNISGRYARSRRHGVLEPLKPFPYTIVIPLGKENGAHTGDMVSAVLLPPKSPVNIRMMQAKVMRLLDIPGNVGEDLRLVSAKYSLSWQFPEEVEEEAKKAARIDFERELSRRKDLRNRVLFTIDGVNARDFDDAVGIELLQDETWLLTVAIADVAHAVKAGASLDKEARDRSFSVYFPETSIPMLPEVLSNGMMSLNPDEDRLAMVVEIRIGSRGKVISYECFEAVIRSRARLTYEAVGPFLEGESEVGDLSTEVSSRLLMLHRLAGFLTEMRRKRGSLDFDLAAVDITMGSTGDVESINRIRNGPAEKLIEEAMLLTNQTVCSFLRKHQMPILYRVHEKPKPEDLLDLAETLSEIGLPQALLKRLKQTVLTGEKVSEVLQAISTVYQGSRLEAFAHLHILRALPRAHYSSEDLGHFGLACEGYLHFTSPIRRYPDLAIHRLMKKVLNGQAIPKKEQGKEQKFLTKLGPEVSEKEQHADAAMMEAVKLKTAAFMANRMGEEFQAVITSIFPYGSFVEVIDPPVDGLVRSSEASKYQPRGGRTKEKKRVIGDIVPVKLIRVDRIRGQMEFLFV